MRVAVVGATGQVDGPALSVSHRDLGEGALRSAVQIVRTLLARSA